MKDSRGGNLRTSTIYLRLRSTQGQRLSAYVRIPLSGFLARHRVGAARQHVAGRKVRLAEKLLVDVDRQDLEAVTNKVRREAWTVAPLFSQDWNVLRL